MARRSAPPPPKQPANLSVGDIKTGILKLQRRLANLAAYHPAQAEADDTVAQAMRDRIDGTLIEVFGADTLDYDRYRIYSLYEGRTIYPFGAPPGAVLKT